MTHSPTGARNETRPDAFSKLGLGRTLCRAIHGAGYSDPTPIQHAAIPLVLDDYDILGCAQTGTGKTAAFALPILQLIKETGVERPAHGPMALVLAPTRELAAQIAESFERYAAGTKISSVVIFGGVKRNPQVAALAKHPHVVVATPGRLLDLMSTNDISLKDVEHVVLDEADRMLDMGFIHDMRKILEVLPEDRQTLLFSATMPREIEQLAAKFLYEPKRIAVDPVSSTREPIEQYVCKVEQRQKIRVLVEMLRGDPDIDRALVFTRTKHAANRVAQRLDASGIAAAAIHGNKSQSARERALSGFKEGNLRVVVATDLAARGIDVKSLSHVVNFDLPNEPETYVHRVGRTGRAGETGIAIAFCSQDEREYLADIEKLIQRKLKPMEIELTQADDVEPMMAGEREGQGQANQRQRPRSRAGASKSAASKSASGASGGRSRGGEDKSGTRRRRRRRGGSGGGDSRRGSGSGERKPMAAAGGR